MKMDMSHHFNDRIEWTEEIDKEITQGFQLYGKEGLISVARSFGLTPRCVRRRMDRLNRISMGTQANLWTEEQIDILKAEWEKGSTGSVIGNLIGKSRNAVIGKANRLKLSQRAPRNGYTIPLPSQKKREYRRRVRKVVDMVISTKKATPPRFYAAAVPLTNKAPIQIMGLNASTCHAIVGRGPDGLATYCGDFTFADKPYCEGHCALYYQLPKARDYRSYR
jgi:hypothetical protein